MGHLKGNFTPVLYIGCKVPKGWWWAWCVVIIRLNKEHYSVNTQEEENNYHKKY